MRREIRLTPYSEGLRKAHSHLNAETGYLYNSAYQPHVKHLPAYLPYHALIIQPFAFSFYNLYPTPYNLFMAITSSAKKAIRSSAKKHVFNIRRKEALHDATKSLLTALASKNVGGAEKLLPVAYKAIDKAMKRGVIKKNTATRKKSRLALAIKRAKVK